MGFQNLVKDRIYNAIIASANECKGFNSEQIAFGRSLSPCASHLAHVQFNTGFLCSLKILCDSKAIFSKSKCLYTSYECECCTLSISGAHRPESRPATFIACRLLALVCPLDAVLFSPKLLSLVNGWLSRIFVNTDSGDDGAAYSYNIKTLFQMVQDGLDTEEKQPEPPEHQIDLPNPEEVMHPLYSLLTQILMLLIHTAFAAAPVSVPIFAPVAVAYSL